MATLYGITNCDTVKRARAWLEGAGVAHLFHDYKTAGVPEARLRRWVDRRGWEAALNRAGTTFRNLPDWEKTELDAERAIALMLAHPSAIRRPVLEQGDLLLVGLSPVPGPQRYAGRLATGARRAQSCVRKGRNMATRVLAPRWLTAAAVVLLLWNLLGAYACIQQFRLGAEAMGPATDYDRRLYASMPVWYNWCFALAELAGVGGALALLARRAVAVPLFAVSLLAVVVQFGYLFATSDIIAVKGVWTTYFPLFIAAVCVAQLWLAARARAWGWIG